LAFLSFLFVYLSIDEAVGIHELTIAPLHDALGTGGVFYFAWVIPAILLLGAMGLAYLNFLRHLPGSVSRLVLSAAAIYLVGALGGDIVGGHWVDRHGAQNLTYALMTQVEESLETFGLALFIFALLTHLARAAPRWGIHVEDH
jgi:hypothetical protein